MNLKFTHIIIDASSLSAEMIELVLNEESKCVSLYKGGTEENLEEFAPYLLSCNDNEKLTETLTTNFAGKNSFVGLNATTLSIDLHKHFRKFLIVKTEEGKQLYFRFYDPRVLRIFLPTCDKAQLIEFFGPVQSFICEDEDPAFALKFYLQNGELKTERLAAASLFGSSAEINTQAVVSNVISQPQAKETPKSGKNLWMD